MFWETTKLTRDAQHFMGERFPAGTLVQARPYDRDDHYAEIVLPDGSMLTVEWDLLADGEAIRERAR